jgi:hypothetical protein
MSDRMFDSRTPDVDELLSKADAIAFARHQMEESGLDAAWLAERTGLEEADVRAMLSGRVSRYGMDEVGRLVLAFGAGVGAYRASAPGQGRAFF